VEGIVSVGEGTVIERSRLRGPLVIGKGVTVRDAYIGPFSAIADGVELSHCEIEHSIILERSRIHDLSHRIESSLIGRDAVVTTHRSKPRAHRLMIGDSSHVELA
jgi:glucose-1-phosphate thymidylyltransferase